MKTNRPMYILGINTAYHELSACIIKDGKLLAAVEEERFSRIKRGKKALVNNPNVLPEKAIEYCFKVAGISFKDVNFVGLSFNPEGRLSQNLKTDQYFMEGDWGSEAGERLFYEKIKQVPSMLKKFAGSQARYAKLWVPHHICHASSAFFVSPFDESAVMTIDGIGELSSTWMGYGTKNQLGIVKEISYPNSLGFLWEKFSKYLGFTEYDSSKIMGLSAYGDKNRFYKKFQKFIQLQGEGEFSIDINVMKYRLEDYKPLEKIFGIQKINSPAELTQDQKDLAAGLQKITDDVVLHLAKYLKEKTQSQNLCLAGGVALNCVTNNALMNSGLFKNLYVQPAANDAGTALGAAYYIWHEVLDEPRSFVMDHVYWGPEFTDQQIEAALKQSGVHYTTPKSITQITAQKLSEGNIIGWFQGRVEWGPRALGHRTLLGDPRRADMKQILNERIKKREPFRPFAPSVLSEKVHDWFVVPKKCESISTEFMEINMDVKKAKQKIVPAITHNDGTSRIQAVNKKTNPLYHKLITDFDKITGVPLVLNTSFNENEPIVCSPQEAIETFQRTKMDYLAIGKFFVSKE